MSLPPTRSPVRRPMALAAFGVALCIVAAPRPTEAADVTKQAARAPLPERPAPCDKPAYLVVVATSVADPVKTRQYAEALRASGLYPQLGGFYVAVGRSPEVLEGKMFGQSPIVIAKFPCREAIQRFWYSDTYQKEILPLREGAGTFEVAMFEERLDGMQPR